MSMQTMESEGVPLRSGSGTLDIGDALRLTIDRIWVVVLITLLVTGVAGLYVFFAKPMYSADALLRVDLPNADALGLDRQRQNTSDATVPDTQAEIQLIQSRTVLMPVIDKYRLDILARPKTFPVLGPLAEKFAKPGHPGTPWFGLDDYAWGGEQIDIDALTVPPALEDKTLELRVLDNNRFTLLDPAGRPLLEGAVGTRAQVDGITIDVSRLVAHPGTRFEVTRLNSVTAIDMLARDLRASEQGKDTGVIQVSYTNDNPVLATQVANSIVQGYIASNTTRHQEEASKMLAFINDELPRLQAELKTAESKLSAYQTRTGSMQPTAENQAYLQGGIDYGRQIAALRLQRTQLLERFTPESPEIRTIDQQLAVLEGNKQRLDARFNSMPTAERQSVELTRNAKVAEQIYVAMINKAHELAVRRAGDFGNVHIIDDALRPSKPVRPRRLLIMAVGIVLGLILGVLYVLLRRQCSSRVEDPLLVEHRFRMPVFGSVRFCDEQARLLRDSGLRLAMGPVRQGDHEPRLNHAMALPAPERTETPRTDLDAASVPDVFSPRWLIAIDRPYDLSIEALRSVRAALWHSMRKASNNVLVVTGPTPATGKSFIASNLAVLEAEAGRRVLLIDADMRRGRLGAHFGRPGAEGLSELLAGRCEVSQAVQPTGIGGLSFIASGRTPGNPSELLSMRRMEALLEMFGSQFDDVIIDTPPVLAVADASIAARYAGSTLLVLRPNFQTTRDIEDSVLQLERAGAHVLGTLFNAVPVRRSARRHYVYTQAYTSMPNSAGW